MRLSATTRPKIGPLLRLSTHRLPIPVATIVRSTAIVVLNLVSARLPFALFRYIVPADFPAYRLSRCSTPSTVVALNIDMNPVDEIPIEVRYVDNVYLLRR